MPTVRWWFVLLLLAAGGGIAAAKPAAKSTDGIVSVGYVSEVGCYTGAEPPKATPEQALLSVVEQRTFPAGGGQKVPVGHIRVTDSTNASYPLIAIAARRKSKEAPVYKVVNGSPLPATPPEGFSSPDGFENTLLTDKAASSTPGTTIQLSGIWKRLYKLEGKVYLPVGAGFFEEGNLKRKLLVVVPAKGPDEMQIEFAEGPLTLNYLFLVPRAASGLTLRFGAEAPVVLSVK